MIGDYMKLKSYAKINLSLDVLSKRPDQYHNIDTIMAYTDWHDEITIQPNEQNELHLFCDNPSFPLGKENLIYRAWESLSEYYPENYGLDITVKKNIPIAAGLAGGSSNCAVCLKAMMQLWKITLSPAELKKLCESLGADVYFFFQNDMVRATGIGTDFEPIATSLPLYVLLINNGQAVSTKYVYENISLSENSHIGACVEAIRKKNIDQFKSLFYNTMQPVVEKIYPMQDLIASLYSFQSVAALMSGSGPTVFGLFEFEEDLEKAFSYFYGKYPYVYKTKLR